MKVVMVWRVIKNRMPEGTCFADDPALYFGPDWRTRPAISSPWMITQKEGGVDISGFVEVQLAVIDNRPCWRRVRS